MAQMQSGRILQEARERKGYDLDTVARRLRIRPDILRAIEAGDFASMPPRGYTRNMVNAYARLVGLNPTEIVNMYLDEAYANQVQRARRSQETGSYFDMGESTRRARFTGRVARYDEDLQETPRRSSRRSSQQSHYSSGANLEDSAPRMSRSGDRIVYDDRTRFARDDYGNGTTSTRGSRSSRSGRGEDDFLSHHSGYPSSEFRFMDERGGGRFSRSRNIQVGTTPMEYSSSRVPAFLHSRLGLVIAAIVVVLLLVLLVSAARGCHKEDASTDVTQLPVTGINDTTDADAEEAAAVEAATVAIAPTAARVAYAANNDEGCYVQIEQDGNESYAMLDRTEQTVDVTGTWTIATWTPDYLDLTVDGNRVQLSSNEEYGGMYTYTVDFAQILAAWQESHPDTSASRREAATAAAEAAQANAAAEAAAAEEAEAAEAAQAGASGTTA